MRSSKLRPNDPIALTLALTRMPFICLFHIDLSSNLTKRVCNPGSGRQRTLATGLGALGVLGWRRKRKASAITAA